MRCEICGRIIQGQPQRVLVDTAVLLVCGRCARYGTPVSRPRPIQGLSTHGSSSPGLLPSMPTKTAEPSLDVVPDYDLKVKKAREELGLTQEVLAKLVGEKLSVIKRIELGKLKPSLELVRKLEKTLKIKLVEELREDETGQATKPRADLTLGDVVVVKERKKGKEVGE